MRDLNAEKLPCCDDHPARAGQLPTVIYSDLAPDTFCCMAQMSYSIAAKLTNLLTGVPATNWWELASEERFNFAIKARAFLVEEQKPETSFEKAFHAVLVTITS